MIRPEILFFYALAHDYKGRRRLVNRLNNVWLRIFWEISDITTDNSKPLESVMNIVLGFLKRFFTCSKKIKRFIMMVQSIEDLNYGIERIIADRNFQLKETRTFQNAF